MVVDQQDQGSIGVAVLAGGGGGRKPLRHFDGFAFRDVFRSQSGSSGCLPVGQLVFYDQRLAGEQTVAGNDRAGTRNGLRSDLGRLKVVSVAAQGNGECGPHSHLTVHRQPPAMKLDQLFGQRQADTRPHRLVRRVPTLEEPLEEPRYLLGRNATTRVAHSQVDVVVAHIQLDRDAASSLSAADSVGKKVGKYFVELLRIDPQPDCFVGKVLNQLETASFCCRKETSNHAGYVASKLRLAHFELESAGLETRRVEQLIDQREKTGAVGAHLDQIAPLLCRQRSQLLLEEILDRPEDQCQRRP